MKKYLKYPPVLFLICVFSCNGDDDTNPRVRVIWEDFYSAPNDHFYISSLVLDNNDYIWLTSYEDTSSLRMFDGVSWKYFNAQNDTLLNKSFDLIYNSNEQKLWKGSGIVIDYNISTHINGTKYRYWAVYSMNTPLVSEKLKIDKNGNVWQVASAELKKFDGREWNTFSLRDIGLANDNIAHLCFDLAGNLLISTLPERGTHGKLLKFDGQSWELFYTCTEPGDWVSSVAVQESGKIWLGVLNREAVGPEYGGGIVSYDGQRWDQYTILNSNLPSNSVVDIWPDGNGYLWVGTYNAGFSRLDKNNSWLNFDNSNTALPFPYSVEHIISDSHGSVWLSVQFFGLAKIDILN